MADDATVRALLSQPLRLGKGRRTVPLAVRYERELTLDDLLHASTEEAGIKAPPLKSLRQSHHMLARMLATGHEQEEISAVTGYCTSRISILKSDPSFANLVSYYEGLEAEEHERYTADMHKRLAALGFDTIEVLHERMIENPESFTAKDLIAAVELVADRTGHGKSSTVNHNHEYAINDQALAAIKATADRGRPLTEADRTALLGMATGRPAEPVPCAEEGEGVEGEWTVVREEGGEGDQEKVPVRPVAVPYLVPVQRPER